MKYLLRLLGIFLIVGQTSSSDLEILSNPPHQPSVSIKSSIGVTSRKSSGIARSGREAPVAQWTDTYNTDTYVDENHSQHHGVQEKSNGILDALVLAFPLLFVPALLLALLYFIWAGSYSSYNYHNNYPNSYGTMGGQAVGFGHYGNGGQGGSGGHRKKSDRRGDTSISHVLAQKIEQVTPPVLASISKP